jgi:hypothetical protein
MKIGEAIDKLKDLGEDDAAKALDEYESRDGDNKGWDGWFRKQFPHLADDVIGVKACKSP